MVQVTKKEVAWYPILAERTGFEPAMREAFRVMRSARSATPPPLRKKPRQALLRQNFGL
jgi:hypothetical protein